jgi:hypothetical protein
MSYQHRREGIGRRPTINCCGLLQFKSYYYLRLELLKSTHYVTSNMDTQSLTSKVYPGILQWNQLRIISKIFRHMASS